ncbi:MAG: hypothetical protein Kapaf2KO_17310 [Candidatus Kapaibacteriales bacterium]
MKAINSYYPFGMTMHGLTMPDPAPQLNSTYTINPNADDMPRYGFNGMERDGELKGASNSYDFGARIYDPRVGRFLSLDPLAKEYPSLSDYAFLANMPIRDIDVDGKFIFMIDKKPGLYVSLDLLSETNTYSEYIARVSESETEHIYVFTAPYEEIRNGYGEPSGLAANEDIINDYNVIENGKFSFYDKDGNPKFTGANLFNELEGKEAAEGKVGLVVFNEDDIPDIKEKQGLISRMLDGNNYVELANTQGHEFFHITLEGDRDKQHKAMGAGLRNKWGSPLDILDDELKEIPNEKIEQRRKKYNEEKELPDKYKPPKK